jgi:hypothetical protein
MANSSTSIGRFGLGGGLPQIRAWNEMLKLRIKLDRAIGVEP